MGGGEIHVRCSLPPPQVSSRRKPGPIGSLSNRECNQEVAAAEFPMKRSGKRTCEWVPAFAGMTLLSLTRCAHKTGTEERGLARLAALPRAE